MCQDQGVEIVFVLKIRLLHAANLALVTRAKAFIAPPAAQHGGAVAQLANFLPPFLVPSGFVNPAESYLSSLPPALAARGRVHAGYKTAISVSRPKF